VILALETSTTNCSVGLIDPEEGLLVSESLNDGYSHAERMGGMVQQILIENQCSPDDLTGVAVGDGPGSYTGLRISASFAKGVAYAQDIPLIKVCSLANMYYQVKNEHTAAGYLALLDARRMEVYQTLYIGEEQTEVKPAIIDDVYLQEEATKSIIYFGTGAEKCEPIFNNRKNWKHISGVIPSVVGMVEVVKCKWKEKKFEDTAYYEPNYIKSFKAGARKRWF